MAPRLSDQIEYGKSVMRAVIGRMDQLAGIDSKDEPPLIALGLHATIVELYAGCLELAEHSATAGIPILLRSMFEALVDLDNFGRYGRDYHRIFLASEYENLLKFVKTEALVASGIAAGSKDSLSEFAEQLEGLKRQRVFPLSIRERCKRVDRESEYLGMFRLLSMDTHNGAGALADRHFRETESGGLELSVLGEPDPDRVAIRLNIGAAYVIDSAQIIHGVFHTASAEAILELGRTHDARRARQSDL